MKRAFLTLGSVSREEAADEFAFLAERFPGRRKAIRAFTHAAPEFVFWIHPDGLLHDARDSHKANVPRGHEHILDDEPDYRGFLRGRVVRGSCRQLIVVYCRSEALASSGPAVDQLLAGLEAMPLRVEEDALVVSDNADLYGTYADLQERAAER